MSCLLLPLAFPTILARMSYYLSIRSLIIQLPLSFRLIIDRSSSDVQRMANNPPSLRQGRIHRRV